MRTLGLIGGTTWVSTLEYYRLINKFTAERLGGFASAKIILNSVNFADIVAYENADDWKSIESFLSSIASKLQAAGADAVMLCANTMHIAANAVEAAIDVPLLHIVDAVAAEIKRLGTSRVGLIGTRFTMEKPFYTERLAKSGISTIIPPSEDRDFIHASIDNELGKDIFRDETRAAYLRIIDALQADGAEAVILGCTEIPLLVKQNDCQIPVLDTTSIHARYAVDFALG